MSASASRAQLTAATRQLQAEWSELRGSWRDQKAAEFEDLYLADLSDMVNSAARAIEDLDKVLQKIHADCE